MEKDTSMVNDSVKMIPKSGLLAQVACNSCRTRKRKCDEKKPICGACSLLKLRCIYDTPRRSKLDTFLQNISASLDALRNDMDTLVANSLQGQSPSASPWQAELPNEESTTHVSIHPDVSLLPHDFQHFGSKPATEHKFKHATSAHKLYAWPNLQQFAPDVDMSYPTTLEMRREPLTYECCIPRCLVKVLQAHQEGTPSNWYDTMSLSQIRQLTECYFNEFHSLYPILDRTTFAQITLGKFIESGLPIDENTCLMLLVFALGSFTAYYHGSTEWGHEGESILSPVGIGFFNEARRIMIFLPKGKTETAQCNLLAGLYHAQLLRSYDFWYHIHEAATIFSVIVSNTPVDRYDPYIIRGYWITYVLESNILAEFDLPMSDLFQFQDLVPLPFGPETKHSNVSEAHPDYQFVFLAHITLRRLLNRVHQSLYHSEASSNVAPGVSNPSKTLIQELSSQLEQWLQYIPKAISSYMTSCNENTSEHLMPTPTYPNNMLDQLRGRYWAAKSVIYRPVIYKALHSHPDSLTPEDYDDLKHCLEAAFNIPLAMGILTETPRLIAAPVGPIRSFMAAYILMYAVRGMPHLSSFAGPLMDIAEHLRERIESEFAHLSPMVGKDLELLKTMHNISYI